jgi:recombination associated protein RdgC
MKNAIILKINGDTPIKSSLAQAMEELEFPADPPKNAARFVGWVSPRKRKTEDAKLLESIGTFLVGALKIRTRKVPKSVVDEAAEKLYAKIEDETGRRPSKKQRRELAQQINDELLINAFPRDKVVGFAVDTVKGLVYVEASSMGAAADSVLSALAAVCPTANLHPLQTEYPPAQAMTNWILEGPPAEISIDDAGTFEGEQKSRITVKGRDMEGENVAAHLSEGMTPSSLSLTIGGRLSLVLTDQLYLRRIEVLDIKPEASDDAWTGETLVRLCELSAAASRLVDELGGEKVLPIEAAAKADECVPDEVPA